MKRLATAVLLLALLGAASCGEDVIVVSEIDSISRTPEAPPWAKVAPEQFAEAKKHGVPVAFENDLGMRFVLIPAGTFLMGSPEDEAGRNDDETQREVTITKPYYMQITEVTNGQYRRWRPYHDLTEWGGHALDDPTSWREYARNDDSQPVDDRAWDEAKYFAKWLSGQRGERRYALPTEVQWERACRAGTTGRFWWGSSDAESERYANAADPKTKSLLGLRGAAFAHDDGHRVSAPVGSYEPNGWGLHDMLGNVEEWCLDLREGYTEEDLEHPTGDEHMFRGGSWGDGPRFLRCAHRSERPMFGTFPGVGFRLVSPMPGPSDAERDRDQDRVSIRHLEADLGDGARLSLHEDGRAMLTIEHSRGSTDWHGPWHSIDAGLVILLPMKQEIADTWAGAERLPHPEELFLNVAGRDRWIEDTRSFWRVERTGLAWSLVRTERATRREGDNLFRFKSKREFEKPKEPIAEGR